MVEIVQIHRDYRHGQHDFVLNAHDGGDLQTRIGYLSYSVFEGEPSVSYIFVEPARRNERVGSELVLELQRLYPDTCINFGFSTDDGTGLLASFDWKIVPNEKLAAASREFSQNSEKLADYEARSNAMVGEPQLVKDAFFAETSDWNDLLDRQEELERLIRTEPAEFRYAVAAKPTAATLGI